MADPVVPEIPEIPVTNAMVSSITAQADPAGQILIPKGREGDLVSEVRIAESLEAPVEKGQTVGKVVYTLDGETVCELQIRASEPAERMTFSSVFQILLWDLLSIS